MTAVNIFVSYSESDADSGRQVKELLSPHVKNATIITSQHLNIGDNWHVRVQEALKSANIFIMLYSAKTGDNGYVLFEAGFFVNSRKNAPIFVIHDPGIELPALLAEFAKVPADPKSMATFLTHLFGGSLYKDMPALNPRLAADESDVAYIAERLCRQIFPQTEEIRFVADEISIEITNPSLLLGGQMPATAKIRSARSLSGLFGFDSTIAIWREIDNKCSKIWREKVSHMLESIAKI